MYLPTSIKPIYGMLYKGWFYMKRMVICDMYRHYTRDRCMFTALLAWQSYNCTSWSRIRAATGTTIGH